MNLVPLAYQIFIEPLPLWSNDWEWSLLLIPLCLVVSLVYKTIKCQSTSQIIRETLELFATIVVLMVLAAVVLLIVVRLVSQ